MTLGQNNSAGRDLKVRFMWLGLSMMLGLLMLAVGLYRLQLIRGDEYAAKSVANFIKEVRIQADRGMIKDARGEILVENRPSFDLFITPAFCQNCATEVLPKLASWLHWDETQRAAVENTLKQAKRSAPFRPVQVQIDLTREEHDVINARNYELPGVEPLPVHHRQYPQLAEDERHRENGPNGGVELAPPGTELSHVLGYMNEITQDELEQLNAKGASYGLGDYVGRRGIERHFETQLRGVDGVRKEVVNAKGKAEKDLHWLLGDGDVVPPKPGNNVILSIDMRLQREAERAFPANGGAVVAIDVKTGFIKAIVSRPNYDSNLLTGRVSPQQMAALARDPLQPMIFRPTQQHYSPGSTFKMITALAALQNHKLTPTSTINCPGGYRLGSRVWRCDNERGHGPIALRTALQRSCNVFFYKLGDALGLDGIADMGRRFGFGSVTGLGVVPEVPGIMPDTAYYERVSPQGAFKGMALNSAIGQGDDNVTPLQLAMAYATLANGGTLYQPQLVQRIETPEGKVVEQFEPKISKQTPLDPEHRRVIIDALKAVVNEPGGTGGNARLPNVTVAGKTGTAQVVRLGKVRLKANQIDYWARDNAWFASFAPAEDPEIVVVVLNEHAGFGASGAAPTAGRVLKKYFELKVEDTGMPLPTPAPTPRAAAAPVPAKAEGAQPEGVEAKPAALEEGPSETTVARVVPAVAVEPAIGGSAAAAPAPEASKSTEPAVPTEAPAVEPKPAPPSEPAAAPAPAPATN